MQCMHVIIVLEVFDEHEPLTIQRNFWDTTLLMEIMPVTIEPSLGINDLWG